MSNKFEYKSLVEMCAHARLILAQTDSHDLTFYGDSLKNMTILVAGKLGVTEHKFKKDSVERYRELLREFNKDKHHEDMLKERFDERLREMRELE